MNLTLFIVLRHRLTITQVLVFNWFHFSCVCSLLTAHLSNKLHAILHGAEGRRQRFERPKWRKWHLLAYCHQIHLYPYRMYVSGYIWMKTKIENTRFIRGTLGMWNVKQYVCVGDTATNTHKSYTFGEHLWKTLHTQTLAHCTPHTCDMGKLSVRYIWIRISFVIHSPCFVSFRNSSPSTFFYPAIECGNSSITGLPFDLGRWKKTEMFNFLHPATNACIYKIVIWNLTATHDYKMWTTQMNS